MQDMDRFKQTYIAECYELLEDMESRLLGLDGDPEKCKDQEELNAIFRCAHSIKGGAGAFGFKRIGEFTHILEELLDKMRDGIIDVTTESIDMLLSSVDKVRFMVQAAENSDDVPEDYGADILQKLMAICAHNISDSAEHIEIPSVSDDTNEISVYDIDFIPHETLYASGNEPLLLLKELGTLGEFEIKLYDSRVPKIADINPEHAYLSWNLSLQGECSEEDIKEVFEFVEDCCELHIEKVAGFNNSNVSPTDSQIQTPIEEVNQTVEVNEPTAQPSENSAPEQGETEAIVKPKIATSVRVDVDKIDKLVNMVGEIVIAQSMLSVQAKAALHESHPVLVDNIEQLSQHTVELQEAVMAVRMQPVKAMFSRVPRLIRDLCGKLGKNIRLEMSGENTELDKTIIEQLSDPLNHMIRNSVDHGIGTPEKRVALGKPEQGVIKLSAEHRGGKIIIQIADDGKGIDRERVKQKAIDNGVISPDAHLSDIEIDNLIFMPGFSTAEEVSDVSGRGVGMDVVRKNIELLGGAVHVINNPGNGTTFEITLPLTLAILDGMVVRVGQEFYVIPLANLTETLKPASDEVSTIANGNDTINVRGEFIAVEYLHKLFNVSGAIENISDALTVIIETGIDRFGLVVDEIVGQQQVVIKSLEENFRNVPGLAAATILGDGKVSLILDVSSLLKLQKPSEKAQPTELEVVKE